MGENFQVVDALLSKVVKDFSALLVSQGTQVIRISEFHCVFFSILCKSDCLRLIYQQVQCSCLEVISNGLFLPLLAAWTTPEENFEGRYWFPIKD
jgi:hypothetical protein